MNACMCMLCGQTLSAMQCVDVEVKQPHTTQHQKSASPPRQMHQYPITAVAAGCV